VVGIDAISYKTGMVKLMPIWDWANHQLINEPVSIALSLCHRPSGLGISSMAKAPQPQPTASIRFGNYLTIQPLKRGQHCSSTAFDLSGILSIICCWSKLSLAS
jgi:hypothetical protein